MNRNCRFEVRLTNEEFRDLERKARKAKLNKATLARRAISGLEVKEAPPVDVPLLIREVRRVGYNIDQLLKRANSQGFIDAPLLRNALNENCEVSRKILAAYTTKEH